MWMHASRRRAEEVSSCRCSAVDSVQVEMRLTIPPELTRQTPRPGRSSRRAQARVPRRGGPGLEWQLDSNPA